MRYLPFNLVLLALLTLSPSHTWGQGQRFIFEQATNLEVVPEVYRVDTDEHGRLWYSTWGRGVFCYDGYNYTRFVSDSDDPNSLINDRVFDLLADNKQRVWVASLSGLSCIDRRSGNVRRYQNLMDSIYQLQALFEDRAGVIWASTHNAILRFDEATQSMVVVQPDRAYSKKNARGRTFLEDAEGTLWASRNDGVFRFAPDRSRYEKIDLKPDTGEDAGVVYAMFERSDRVMLMGTHTGLYYFDRDKNRLTRAALPDSFAYRRINCMVEYPKGTLWIGSHGHGLLRWDWQAGGTHLFENNPADPGSLQYNFILSLTTDRFGNLWMGATRGVLRINLLPQAFALWPLDAKNPLSRTNSVVRMAEDRQGGLLVRTVHELYYVQKLGATPQPLRIQGKKRLPQDFFTGKDGKVWAIDGELFIWDEAQRQFNPFKTPFPPGEIMNMTEDAENPNLLWLGTQHGLQSFDRRSGEVRTFFGLTPAKFEQFLRDLLDDERGSLWLDMPYFLVKFDKKTHATQLFTADTLPPHRLVNNEILDINLAPDGWVWISATGGITRVDPATGHFHNLTRNNGLADNMSSTTLFDKQGSAWIVTPEKIQRFDPSTGAFQTFNTNIAFQTGIWTRGRCELRDGRLIFAGMRGMISLNPAHVNESRPISAILMTRFETSNKGKKRALTPEFLQNIQLSNEENNLTLEWAGIQMARSGELRYACKLEPKGQKSEWEQKGGDRQAVYANLPPGAYTFRVKIVGEDAPELLLNIVIAPAWWQAEWFKMLLMALLATAAYLFWRNREDRRELMQQKELAEQNARYKTRFLANMSHEIRTPMNAIVGLSRLLTESALPPKQSEYADAIRQSSENLLVIINDVLDQAKIESGKFRFQRKPFDLIFIVRHLQNTIGLRAEEKGLRFEAHIAPQTPTRLIGDPVRLNQILTNLLGNAIKFTEQGSVRLSVESSAAVAQMPRLFFRVSDTGIGISEAQLPKVFESFQQADDDISATYGGTGLGLSITKDLVEQQGGQITLESQLGTGTTVGVVLPFELDLSEAMESAPTDQRKVVLENLRILLVEDTFFNQMLAVELLKNRIPGVVIELAENGQIALEKVETIGGFDLILMDVKMPVMDGLEATRRLRALPGGDKHCIIALTANAVPEELEKCRDAGMNAWVTKPIDNDELFATIEKVI